MPTHELIAQRMGDDSNKAKFVRKDVRVEGDMKACVEEATKTIWRLDVTFSSYCNF